MATPRIALFWAGRGRKDRMTSVESIETPALLVDLDALECNIRIMADFSRNRRARLSPLCKRHKSPAICRLQLAAGAKGTSDEAGELRDGQAVWPIPGRGESQ